MSKADDTKPPLVGLLAFVNGKSPRLEYDTTKGTPSKVKVEPNNPAEKASEKVQGAKMKVNVSKVPRGKFTIHGVVVGYSFKDALSFVGLVLQKSATKLYQELFVLHQETNESPQDFPVRALNSKRQIIFVSNATDGSIKYEPSLVQALFLHVFETGLQDESVRAKLHPLLEVPSVIDEQLMERVDRIMSAEAEHQNKMGVAGRKEARINQVETASPLSNQARPSSGPVPRGESSSPRKRSQSQILW